MKILKRIGRSTIEIIIALCVFFIVLGIFSYLSGLFSPVTVNKYILTNGSKTVVFQEMRHVGTGDFYGKVDNDIKYYRSQGYIFGYEGIFLFGGRELYINEKIDYGKNYMEQPILIGGIDEADVNLDLNWIDISNKIENKINLQNEQNKNKAGYIKQTFNDIPMIKNEKAISDEGINIVDYTESNLLRIRYFENLNARFNLDLQGLMNPDHPIEHSVIIDERNKIVADFILKEKNDKILINYGAEHFSGIFKLLQDQDAHWKIVRFEKLDVL